MITLSNCYNSSHTSLNSSSVLQIKNTLLAPSIMLLGAALVLAGIIQLALILSKCFKVPNSLLYFNISLADAIMAAAGITMVLVPTNSEAWLTYQKLALMFLVLRSVWSLTVLSMMINRYRIISGKGGFSISTTYVVIILIWTESAAQAVLWHLMSPGAPWEKINTEIAGVILTNILVLVFALPLPIVIVLLVMISCTARQHLSRIADDENTLLTRASQQIQGDLRLLYAFGVIYIIGYGFNFVASVHGLINLSGFLKVLPHWESNETFCEYLFAFDGLANIIVNFSNSVIIVQSRHVQTALKRMYQATSRVVRKVTGGEIRERLIREEDISQAA